MQKHPWEWDPSLNSKLNYDSCAVFTHRPKAINSVLCSWCIYNGAGSCVTQGQAWSSTLVASWESWCSGLRGLASSDTRLCQLAACRQWDSGNGQLRDHGNQRGSCLPAPPSAPKGCALTAGNRCRVCAFSRVLETKISCEIGAKFIYPIPLGVHLQLLVRGHDRASPDDF